MSIYPRNPGLRILLLCFVVLVLDQASKLTVAHFLPYPYQDQLIVIDGFFRLVHWGNTGAAFNIFDDSNTMLAVIAVLALAILYFNRNLFRIHRPAGQIALGLMLGGIIGNLIDRIRVQHVIDFLYFYTYQRDGDEIGFPAFNVADSAICTGVALLLIVSWKKESPEPDETGEPAEPEAPSAASDSGLSDTR